MVQIMRWVRANLLDPSHTDLEMHVDILIDGDLKVSSGPPYCGWLGKFRSNECFPFICRPNSKGIYCIDFGQNPRDQGMTQSDRLTVFRLNEISVRRGQRIAFYNKNDDDDLPASLNFLVKDAADLITGRSVFDE